MLNDDDASAEDEENNLTYAQLLDIYKSELQHFQFVRKKDMILKLAKKLEESGVQKHKISAIIISDLKGYEIHSKYIREVLPENFKDSAKKREIFAHKIRANSVQDRTMQVINDGSAIIASDNDDISEPEPELEPTRTTNIQIESKDLPSARLEELELENSRLKEQLEEQKTEFKKLIDATNQAMQQQQPTKDKDKDKDKNIVNLLEFETLKSKLILVEQERDELKQIATKQIKEHPEQTFTTATNLSQQQQQPTTPITTLASLTELEAEFPARDLHTFFLDQRNAKNVMYLKIKDGKVVSWETDTMRASKNGRQ